MLSHFRILVGPGDRLAPLVILLTSLREDRLGPDAPLAVRVLADVEGLMQRQGPAGLVLLDADRLDVEDLGIVRRFVQRHPGWELILTGDDDRSRAARRLCSLRRVRWLPWPLDVDQLTAMLTPPAASVSAATGPDATASAATASAATASAATASAATGPAATGPAATAPSVDLDPSAGPAPPLAPRATPEREPEPSAVQGPPTGPPTGPPMEGDLADSLGAVLGRAGLGASVRRGESEEGSLAQDLASIEGILRGEAQEASEQETEPAAESGEHTWEELEEDGQDPDGQDFGGQDLDALELTREELQAFLDDPLDVEMSPSAPVACRAPRAHEATADRPPPWFKAQVGDLIDLAQGLDLSARALRESRAEDSHEAREHSARRLEADVLRLVQFARTLGYLAAPPACGEQRIALATLLEEQLAGLAGADADSPRFLFRAEQEAWVRSDKALLVASFDALLQVAAACSSSRDVVRVAVEPDEQKGQVEVHLSFPAQALAALSPAEVLAPYGLRGVLPGIGANALAAASRILEGQGGRLALGQDGPGDRLLFRVQLPLAADDDLPRPGAGEAQQSDTPASGEFG